MLGHGCFVRRLLVLFGAGLRVDRIESDLGRERRNVNFDAEVVLDLYSRCFGQQRAEEVAGHLSTLGIVERQMRHLARRCCRHRQRQPNRRFATTTTTAAGFPEQDGRKLRLCESGGQRQRCSCHCCAGIDCAIHRASRRARAGRWAGRGAKVHVNRRHARRQEATAAATQSPPRPEPRGHPRYPHQVVIVCCRGGLSEATVWSHISAAIIQGQ